MIAFGSTLRAAREAKGLTIRDIADKTHMMIQIVEDLENENFSKIAAPIYGRGFVKLYCNTVGIDPAPMTEAFMEIFTGKRPSETKSEVQAPPPPPPPPPPPAPVEKQPDEKMEPSQTEELDEGAFRLVSEEASFTPAPPPRKAFTPTCYTTHEFEKPKITIPPVFWRFLALAIAAGAILWIAIAGIKALYSATMTPPKEKSVAVEKPAPEKPKQDKKPAKPAKAREQIEVPPLYID